MRKIITIALSIIMSGSIATHAMDNEKTLSFPSAEGYGKYTVGGRGGTVYEVTNLNNSGKGSLRAAIEAKGPRTVVFRVSGTIELESALNIRNPYITIAGQTAPGDGICIKNYPLIINADQVIVRYIRARVGDQAGREDDAVSSRFHKNIIIDHVSASWSVDETFSIYHCDSVTVQWCIIAESLYKSNHSKGSHGFGGICGSNHSTYHHNLIAHHSSRNLRMCSATGYFDYRNNVIYNWGYNSCYGGENKQDGFTDYDFTYINLMGNYYKPGPATNTGEVNYRIANPSLRNDVSDYGKWYIADNHMAGYPNVTVNNWLGVHPSGGASHKQYVKADSPWTSMEINYQTAENAYEDVLKYAGASAVRDNTDKRIINDVRTGTATCEGTAYKENRGSRLKNPALICGIIDSQTDTDGWPELKSLTPPDDSDHDGMPDKWETAHGLNPDNPDDGKTITANGYTNLENYLNTLTEQDRDNISAGMTSIISRHSNSHTDVYTLSGRRLHSNHTDRIYIKDRQKTIRR